MKLFRKSQSKFPKVFFFFSRRPAKSCPTPYTVAGLKPLNYTIFKALGKKDGSRKQVHLWQVSKVSQLRYYLLKIFQDNEFFYSVKKRPKIPIVSTFVNNEILQNFEGENHSLVHRTFEELLYLRKALLL